MSHTHDAPDAATIRLTALDHAIRSFHGPTSSEGLVKRASEFHNFLTGSEMAEEATVSESEESIQNRDAQNEAPDHTERFLGAHAAIHEMIRLVNAMKEDYSGDMRVTVSDAHRVVWKMLVALHNASPLNPELVEIGGQVMTLAQYEAARFPLLGDIPTDAVHDGKFYKSGWNDAISAALDGGIGYRDEAQVTAGTVRSFVNGLRK